MENTICLPVDCDLHSSVQGNCSYSPYSANSKCTYSFFTRTLAPFFSLKKKKADFFQLTLQFWGFFNPFYTLQILDSLLYSKRTNECLIYTRMEKRAQVSAQEDFGNTSFKGNILQLLLSSAHSVNDRYYAFLTYRIIES